MKKQQKRQIKSIERAFTIIEVVLVLAIAGLIFLMVFIALPALQRSQRNTERKRQVDLVYTAVIEYQKNNKNDPPCKSWSNGWWGCEYDTAFINRYVDDQCEYDYQQGGIYYYEDCGEQFTDPDGTTYSLVVYGDTTRAGARFGKADDEKKEQKGTVSLASATIAKTAPNSTTTMAAFGRQARAEDLYDHAMFLIFGYICSETEGRAYITYKPNDFIVALRLEGGGMYCHGSSTGEDRHVYGEYNIIPDWGGYYGMPE